MRQGKQHQRCPDCCPICKHQCMKPGRHAGFLHECSQHYWGGKRGRGRTITNLPPMDMVMDDHEELTA